VTKNFRLVALVFAVIFVVSPALTAADTEIVVTPIWREGQLLVSFELSDGVTAEMRDAIQSGLPTSYAYDLEVRRGDAGWFAKPLLAMTITATVRFDNLTRRYQLSRTVGTQSESTSSTDNQDAVRRWLTRFDHVAVLTTSALEANGEYSVRVRVQTRPHSAWFVWPWDRGSILGNAKFTFIP
jgi:hypothetical protein